VSATALRQTNTPIRGEVGYVVSISYQECSVLEVPLPAETTSAHHLQHVDQVVPAQLNPSYGSFPSDEVFQCVGTKRF